MLSTKLLIELALYVFLHINATLAVKFAPFETNLVWLKQEEIVTPRRQEGAETPSMSLDLPRDAFSHLVQQEAAARAGEQSLLKSVSQTCSEPASCFD